MYFQFPYQFGHIDGKKIPYPVTTVFLNTINGPREFLFIVDTGADRTTLPNFMLKRLIIDHSRLQKSRAQGIGKNFINTWETTLPITFCQQTFSVHCSFTDNDQTPLLLGKEDIFDKFSVEFDNRKFQTIFKRI